MKVARYASLLFWILIANGVMWAGGTTDWLCREKSYYDPKGEGLSFEGKYCQDGEWMIANTFSGELMVRSLRLLIPEGSDLTPGIFFPYVWIGLYSLLVLSVLLFRRSLYVLSVGLILAVHRRI
jgi:hypothetical protein